MTTFEVVGNIVIPYTRVGVIGGVMLALGRALGETMAVTFVIGNAPHIQSSILAQGTTISAMIANRSPTPTPACSPLRCWRSASSCSSSPSSCWRRRG